MKINEIEAPDAVKDVQNFIWKNCQPWMKATDNGQMVFYRGNSKVPAEAYSNGYHVEAVHKDRRPKDSTPELHQFFNRMISIAGGVANRSNSAFVTSSENEAAEYGNHWVYMPIGNFNYTWHDRWVDWFNSAEVRGGAADYIDYKAVRKELGISGFDSLKRKVWDQLRPVFGFTSFDPMPNVDVSKYTADNLPVREDYIRRDIHVDTGLEDAFTRGLEVMISSEKGLYVDVRLYRQLISQN